jgi:hypothetical protein
MSAEVAKELHMRWKRADWKMITADSNWYDLSKLAESVPDNVHIIVSPVHIFFQHPDPNR